jgi:hypothetical protein
MPFIMVIYCFNITFPPYIFIFCYIHYAYILNVLSQCSLFSQFYGLFNIKCYNIPKYILFYLNTMIKGKTITKECFQAVVINVMIIN